MNRRLIGFAHRGAPQSRTEDNTLAAFQRALSLGARGLESDIGLTADGVPVLVHQPFTIRRSMRVSLMRRSELPASIPTLDDLYTNCGTNFDLAIDMGVPSSVEKVIQIARAHGAEDRLWLTYWNVDTLRKWRERWPNLHLVYPTLPYIRGSLERTTSQLRDAGVDALNMHHLACRSQVRKITSDYGLLLFAWGVRSRSPLSRLIDLPVDGLFCDDTPAMLEVLRHAVSRDDER